MSVILKISIINTVLELCDIRRTGPPDLTYHNALCHVVMVILGKKKQKLNRTHLKQDNKTGSRKRGGFKDEKLFRISLNFGYFANTTQDGNPKAGGRITSEDRTH